jgi:hypothetical protein
MSDRPGDATYGFVTTIHPELGEALLVFCGPEEAFKFRAETGLYPAEEGYRVLGMGHDALDALLKLEGIGYVVVPEPWVGGDGGVDVFEADVFIEMLEESLVKE